MSSEQVSTVEKLELKVPSLFKVVLLNDDFTPMDFVVEILKIIFQKTASEAVDLTMEVHDKGKGTAGVYTKEIALQKVEETTILANKFGHPLKVVFEEA